HQHVEALRTLAGQRCARVALDNGDLRARLADVGEHVARDGLDGGVDLVEADAVAGPTVRRNRSRAQPDYADTARLILATVAQGNADAGVERVVAGGRFSLSIAAEDLRAVLDGAVGECAQHRAGEADILFHPQRAVEVAPGHGGSALEGDVEP